MCPTSLETDPKQHGRRATAPQFSTPIHILFLTNALILLLLLPLLILTCASPPLRRAHYPLMALPLATTLLTYLLALLSHALVRRAKEIEGKRVVRMVAAAAARQAEEGEG
jgi:amino acid transporter